MKEKQLDKATIDTYQAWVQWGIRRDLNSIALGPGKFPCRFGVFLFVLAIGCFLVGVLLVALRMRHVYLWDWGAQFLGPFFFILFLLCFAGATYMFLLAKRRSNKYRSQLYFRPIGDWGVTCIHKSELALEEQHDLKSGTNPTKSVKPRSEAYSQSSKDGRRARAQQQREGRDNYAYDTQNPNRRPDDRRRGPPNGQRGPPPGDRRGPPPGDRRGPPPGDRRGPPPGDRRGPPPGDRRGPPPGDRRGPPPGDRRDTNDRPHYPPPAYDGGGPPPEDRRRPPPNGQRPPYPPGGPVRVESDDEGGRRPRGIPRFDGVRRIPDQDSNDVKMIMERSHDESDI